MAHHHMAKQKRSARIARALSVELLRSRDDERDYANVQQTYRCAATWSCISRVRRAQQLCWSCSERASKMEAVLPCGHPTDKWIQSWGVCATCQRDAVEARAS